MPRNGQSPAKDSAQESFTDPDSRVMKRAGGGYDYSYNAHTAVDETAQIVIAAELTNNASDGERLRAMLAAVKANLGEDARQVLADAGFRSEARFEQFKDAPSELIVALGREGKQAVAINAEQYPRTVAMQAKLKTPEAQAGLPQAGVDRGGAQRVDQERAGLAAVQPAGIEEGRRRVQARVHGAEPEKDVCIARCLREI
ncbi:MAG: transposase, partial [Variovorax sp.]|nr:transposase [Variovorax sp.]